MAKKFDISKYAATMGTPASSDRGIDADVSKSDTSAGREQIEYIHIDRIDKDPNNFYEISGIEDLASNIELVGVQQPLRVRTNPEAPERFIIVSGHRRAAAVRSLVDEGKTKFEMIPCIREAEAGSPALQELRLIYANSSTRMLTPAELSRQAERVEMLLYQLKEEGLEFPGRMRDIVSEACRISGTKLARLKVIRKKLVPEYLELFDQNKLPEQTAYALARFQSDFQQRIYKVLKDPPTGSRAEEILEKYEEGERWEPELSCPDGTQCKRGDSFLRRDFKCYAWEGFCCGKQCCLHCDMADGASGYAHCSGACSKAKSKIADQKDQKKAEVNSLRDETSRKYKLETQKNAQRLIPFIDAAGLGDDEKVDWDYTPSQTVATIRKWAAGEFDDTEPWYYDRLSPTSCKNVVEVARKLGCSTDYLLGATDILDPAEPNEGQLVICGWMPGGTFPREPCDVVADFLLCGQDKGSRSIRIACRFNGVSFLFYNGKNSSEIRGDCIRWMCLPPVEDDGEESSL